MANSDLVVVKLGGTTLAEQQPTLTEIAELSHRRELVIVHGGGKRLTDWLDRLDISSRFAGGLRVTDDAALEVAVAVLGGLVNAELVAALRGLGADAVGLTGIDGGLLDCRRQPALGRVATVQGARPSLLYALFAAGMLPVIAPLAQDEKGEVCNVNADDVAAGLAGALHARLVLLTDTDGVRDAAGRPIRALDEPAAERLIADGVIDGGMLPKVRGALAALRSGGSEVVIADGGAAQALQRALENGSFGTRLRLSSAGD